MRRSSPDQHAANIAESAKYEQGNPPRTDDDFITDAPDRVLVLIKPSQVRAFCHANAEGWWGFLAVEYAGVIFQLQQVYCPTEGPYLRVLKGADERDILHDGCLVFETRQAFIEPTKFRTSLTRN